MENVEPDIENEAEVERMRFDYLYLIVSVLSSSYPPAFFALNLFCFSFKASLHINENLSTHRVAFNCQNSFCLFGLLLYVPVNNCGHVGTLVVVRDVR